MNTSILRYISTPYTLLLLLILSLGSCKSVMDNAYSKNTVEGDLERIKAVGGLDSAEYSILTNYMLKKNLMSQDLLFIEKTYGELLREAKEARDLEIVAEEQNKKRKDNKEQFMVDHMKHLHDELQFLPERSEIRKDWSNKNAFFYTMAFINTSDKEVRAFKGVFTFSDLFDTELKSINITYNDPIGVKDTMVYTINVDFSNIFSNTIYVSKDFKDLNVLWQPTKILFTDGTALE